MSSLCACVCVFVCDDDCWTDPSTPYILALIGRHIFHIRFENLARGQAALNSLNLPCILASKLQSHWSGDCSSAQSVFSSTSCVSGMVAEVWFGGARPGNHHPSSCSYG